MINLDLMDSIDFSTPLKLSPKAFLHKYDDNYFLVGLIDKHEANYFLKHLLTVIYSFTDWKSPEELFIIWPENTLNDFIETIKTLINSKLIVNKEDYQNDLLTISSKCCFDKSTSDIYLMQNYFNKIKTFTNNNNSLWMNFSISEDNLNNLKDKFFGNIYFTNADICKVAHAQKDIQQDNLSFISTKSHIFSSICFSSKLNNILFQANNTDIMINNILKSVIYNRKNLLSTEGEVYPGKIRLKAFLFEGLGYQTLKYEADELDLLYGFNFSEYRKALESHTLRFNQKVNSNSIKKLSEDSVIHTFKLNNDNESGFYSEISIDTNESGTLCGVCIYAEIAFDDHNSISLSPFNKLIESEQVIFKLVCPTHKDKGTSLNLKFVLEDDLSLLITY